MAIEWKDSLTLNVPVLDQQHRELVVRAGALIAAMRAHRGTGEIAELFVFVKSHVLTHFAAEEALMRERGYPGYEQHVREHAGLTERVRSVEQRLLRDGPTLLATFDVTALVCDWFFDHIASSDRAIAAWITEPARDRSPPAAPGAAERVPSSRAETPGERMSGRVLVVDDDPAIGRVLGRALAPLKVVFAQSAAGALGRLSAGGQFSAIVCDLHMPGMSGMEFHAEVSKLDAALASRIVYITGARSAPQFASFLDRTGCTCVEKPFQNEELRAAVTAAARSDGPLQRPSSAGGQRRRAADASY